MDGDVNTELTTLVAINMFARVPYQVSTALSDSGPEMLGTVEKCAHRPVKSGKSDRSGWRKTAFAAVVVERENGRTSPRELKKNCRGVGRTFYGTPEQTRVTMRAHARGAPEYAHTTHKTSNHTDNTWH